MTKPMTMDSVTKSLAEGRPLEAAAKYYLLHSGNVTFEAALAHIESISSRVETWKDENPVSDKEPDVLTSHSGYDILEHILNYDKASFILLMTLKMKGITLALCNDCVRTVRTEIDEKGYKYITIKSLGILNKHVAEMIQNHATPDVIQKDHTYSKHITDERMDRIIERLDVNDTRYAAVILRTALAANKEIKSPGYGITCTYMKEAHKGMLKITGTREFKEHAKRLLLREYISELVRNHSPK